MAHIHLPDGVLAIQWILLCGFSRPPSFTITLIIARRQVITAQRLTTAAMVAAASFSIFQVNVPFAGGDLADYNAHTKKGRP